MTALQEQARALGDPTRHAIFQCIAGAPEPLGVADINAHFDLNHNAVRQHLAKLVGAGLVTEAKAAPAGRGRPRLLYALHPAAAGQWGTVGPYERLSRLLLEVLRTGRSPEEVGREAADQFRSAARTHDGVAEIGTVMARQGFEPEVRPARRGTEVVLHHCPFASVALVDRHTVCALHLGIAEGLADDTDTAVEELVAYDPRRAECRLRLRPAPGGGSSADPPGGVLTLRSRPRTAPGPTPDR